MSRRRTSTNNAVPNAAADNSSNAPVPVGGKKLRRDGNSQTETPSAASLEFRTVNNTLQAFTGGRQKSWMLNSNAVAVPTDGTIRTMIRAQTGPLKTRRKPKSITGTAGSKESSVDRNCDAPLLVTIGPGMSPPTAENSTSPEMSNSGLSRTTVTETPPDRSVVMNTFPSPAPSVSPPRTDPTEAQHSDADVEAVSERPRRSIITPGESVQETSEGNNETIDVNVTEDEEEPFSRQESAHRPTSNDQSTEDIASSQLIEERTVQKRPRSTTVEDNPRPEKRSFTWPRRAQPPTPVTSMTQSSGGISNIQNSGLNTDLTLFSDNTQTSPSYVNQTPAGSPLCSTPESVDSRLILPSNFSGQSQIPDQFQRRPSGPVYPSQVPRRQSRSYPPAAPSPGGNIANQNVFQPQAASPVFSPQQRFISGQQMTSLNPQNLGQPQQFPPLPQQQQDQQQQGNTHQPQPRFQNQQPVETRIQVDNRVQILLKALNQFKVQEQHNGFNDVETLRLRLLEQAIVSDDWFFLLLHQVYVTSAISPVPLTPLGITMQHTLGFQALRPILDDNTRLSLRCLTWFAEFPASLSSPLIRQPMCQSTLKGILKFLSEGYKSLLHMQNIALTKMVVFSAHDVARYLALKSSTLETQIASVLQDALFKIRTANQLPTYSVQSPTTLFQQNSAQPTPQQSPQPQALDHFNSYFDTSHGQQAVASSPPVYQAGSVMTGRGTPQMSSNMSTPSQRTIVRADSLSRTGDPPSVGMNGRRSIDAAGMGPGFSPSQTFFPVQGPEYANQAWLDGGQRRGSGAAGTSQQFSNQQSFQPPPQQPAYTQLSLQARRGRDRPLPPVGSAIRNSVYSGPPITPSAAPASGSYPLGSYSQLTTPAPLTAVPVIPQNILQYHLNSPVTSPPPLQGRKTIKTFLSVVDFAVRNLVLTSSCERRTWVVDEDDINRLSKTTPPKAPGEPSKRPMVVPGNLIYRLRCVEVPRGEQIPKKDDEWVVKENVWPKNTFVEVNQKRIELRRKVQWGKDQSADITNLLQAGENELKVVQLSSQQRSTYVMAVEIIESRDEESLMINLERQRVEADAAKAIVLNRLSRSSDSDDVIVSSSTVVLNVFCPMSYSLPTLPVRGRSCRHLECFDYHNYLNSRPKKREWEPPLLDSYRCPLCKGDARPSELIIDGFMVDVLLELRRAGQLDVKNIIVHSDGRWEVKQEKEKETESKRDSKTEDGTVKQLKKEVEIICLEDDD